VRPRNISTTSRVQLCEPRETVTQLLTRLDVAIAKALTEGIRTDEVNPISQQYFPKK